MGFGVLYIRIGLVSYILLFKLKSIIKDEYYSNAYNFIVFFFIKRLIVG